MTAKRYIEFATQNTDNGEINNGFHDIKTGDWYYTKNSENAKKICDVLNELHEENEQLKFQLSECREHKLFSRRELERENKELKRLLQEVEHELISLNGLYVFDKCASQLGYVEVFDDNYWDLDYSEMIDGIRECVEKR